MGRYNKTAIEKIQKAQRHVCCARQNLGYGVLARDFLWDRKVLSWIEDKISAILKEEVEG